MHYFTCIPEILIFVLIVVFGGILLPPYEIWYIFPRVSTHGQISPLEYAQTVDDRAFK